MVNTPEFTRRSLLKGFGAVAGVAGTAALFGCSSGGGGGSSAPAKVGAISRAR